MGPDSNPHLLTPEDRLREVAAVLGRGLIRLLNRPTVAGPAEQAASKNPPDSSQNCLELPAETVLSVHTG